MEPAAAWCAPIPRAMRARACPALEPRRPPRPKPSVGAPMGLTPRRAKYIICAMVTKAAGQGLMEEANSREGDLALALESANIPTLLLLLYQFTGEERWLPPPFTPVKSRWDDNDSGGLLPAMQQEVREAAFDVITAWRAGAPIAKPELTAEELIKMLSFSEAEP